MREKLNFMECLISFATEPKQKCNFSKIKTQLEISFRSLKILESRLH